ncbi:MAG: hypothetical protein AB7F40_10745 [Victivallaceae bacterium]|nr:hypothetical protein [Victivallaceae bacterium]
MDKKQRFSVEYSITRTSESGGGAEIVGQVRMADPAGMLAVASLEVDGIELLPSAKLLFSNDNDELRLPPVRVYRPLPGRDYFFRLVLRTSCGNETVETVLTLA